MKSKFSKILFLNLMPLLLLGITACVSKRLPPPAEWLEAQNHWTPGVDAPFPSTEPSECQKKQIARKYGMFIHFGINTFHDMQWTDGTKPASSYNPPMIDAEQWVSTAKAAGMKYIILITKHHDGFCMWDSPYTDYDVANSGNTTDVIRAVAIECKKQGIELGLYYSLWDRHVNPNVENVESDAPYNEYMIKQIEELMTQYGDICELWLDGAWEKENWRWPIREIYQLVKKHQPNCQIAVNWTIAHPNDPDAHLVKPENQKNGFPIRYFPSDFRLGDPYLPIENDPKLFTYNGETYYMPWESTVCLSSSIIWFWDSRDKGPKSVDELFDIYKKATANDNILIVNIGPNNQGRFPEQDVQRILELKERIDKENLN